MHIDRLVKTSVQNSLAKGKAIILYGPRQVGKTTLVKEILEQSNEKSLYINCDLTKDRDLLTADSLEAQQLVWGDYSLIVIDEAQKVKNIGTILKIAVDHFPEKTFLVTGSSALELADEIIEPLTGRKFTYRLFPIAVSELFSTLDQKHNNQKQNNTLEEQLLYGMYPEVLSLSGNTEKEQYLRTLASDYLYKDALHFQLIKRPDLLLQLLKLLALQIGSEVSTHELAVQLQVERATIHHYLSLLEKAFVICRISPYFINQRKAVTKKQKIYFIDNGVRNALINNFNPLALRNDVGALWENYIIIERLKFQSYYHVQANNYFWRTYAQAEVDWVEERGGVLYGYEIKWKKERATSPKAWQEISVPTTWKLINKDNYLEFITENEVFES